jgi:O-antigen ligase
MTTTAVRDRWDPLLVCVAGYIATSVGRVHQLFPVLLPLKPAILTGAAALLLYVLRPVGRRRPGLVRMPGTTLLILLFGWMALTIPGALYSGLAFSIVIGNFLKTVLLYFLIVASVRTVRDVERLALVYFVSAAVYAAVVLMQFQVSDTGVGWRLGGLFYYDANDFATFAVTAVPLGLYFGFGQRAWGRRLLGMLGLAALSVAFIWSGSRGGFLALIAVALYVLVGYRSLPVRWRVLGAVGVTAVMFTVAGDRYWTQMRTILHPDQDYNQTEEVGRMKTWRRGIGYMLQNPLLGVGAGNFTVAEGTLSDRAELQAYGKGVRWNAAHNTFVQVGAELGVPGLVLLILLIGSAFVALHQVARAQMAAPGNERGPPRLTQALMGSMIGFVVGAMFLSLAYGDMLYALIALAMALRKVAAPQAPAGAPSPRPWMGVSPRRSFQW